MEQYATWVNGAIPYLEQQSHTILGTGGAIPYPDYFDKIPPGAVRAIPALNQWNNPKHEAVDQYHT
jgi:hypothetical protein